MRSPPLKLTTILFALFSFCGGQCAFGSIDEIFELYNSPGGLAMGNALTADASGYIANYYNPAGLAKASKRNWEIIPLAIDGALSLATLGSITSIGIPQIAGRLQSLPNKYYYHRLNFVPSISARGFGTSLLAAYELAARSDGTNLDIHSVTDFGPTVGGAINLFGNRLKIGVALKGILRTEIKESIAHTVVAEQSQVNGHTKEGIGLGADVGIMATWPTALLPTIGLVVQNFGTTVFQASHIADPPNSGVPDKIPQYLNAAFSVHPNFGKRIKGTIAFELKHIERSDLAILSRTNIGFQLEDERSFYLWLGLSQLYWSAGVAYRLPGGNIELGSYGQNVGTATTAEEDRRFLIRYTLGF